MKNVLDHYTNYMTMQLYRFKEVSNKKPHKAPFVTISRQTGAGGISLGKKLIKLFEEKNKNSWLLLDRDLAGQVLKSKGLPNQYLEYMQEGKVSEIKDVFETILNLHPPAFALVREVSETILHLAEVGNVVIVGRGGNILTREIKNGVHVRLIGSLEARVKRVMSFYNLDENQAKDKIKKEDQGRKEYVKQNFGKDIDNPMLYDFTINTDHADLADTAKMLVAFHETKLVGD